jgi:HTH-type transcriptional regulator, sugar sensing transcriptional regulator
MFVTTIEKIGLTEKESKLYLTSLRVGPTSMQILARKAGIDRGTAYHVAQTLTEKGLFEMAVEGKRPLFRATHPKNLFQYVEGKKKEADAHFEAMQEMVSDLEELYQIGIPS